MDHQRVDMYLSDTALEWIYKYDVAN